MIRAAIFCALTSTVLSQQLQVCPSTTPSTTAPCASTPSTTPPSEDSCGNSSADSGPGSGACKKVNTIDRPMSVMFKEQPLHYFMTKKDPRFTRMDNNCLTMFPLPDSPEAFKVYIRWTYIDNLTLTETFITRSYVTGGNYWSTPNRGWVFYNLGYIGCGAYLRYSCPVYGNAVSPFLYGFGPGNGTLGNGVGKLTEECVENARKLAQENGLDLGDYYLLPYNLPTNCYYKQICLPSDSPLSCLQGGTCKAND